ncbi:MAG: hypothetical protein HRT36_00190 [Alphaproteobacteria bacterium]|nr:hypothetical protein [Alphaproteobacteria bacterium]
MTGLLMVFFGGGFGASLRWGVLRLSVKFGHQGGLNFPSNSDCSCSPDY